MLSLDEIKVVGPRILVEPEAAVDSITARAAKIGLFAVVDEKNKPRPTIGRVVKIGQDILFEEWGLAVDMRVTFGPLAGEKQFLEGKEYRLLESHEIKLILPPL